MAAHVAFTLATSIDVYFAHPHSPWERGTNENTNRLFREYFPKGTEITDDQTYLDLVVRELNNRPRVSSATEPQQKARLLPPADTATRTSIGVNVHVVGQMTGSGLQERL